MLKIENTKVAGWEPAIRGMRNPLNSWSKSDSGFATDSECCLYKTIDGNTIDYHTEGLHPVDPGYFKDPDDLGFFIGPNDRKLMKTLRDAGKDHAKYRRMITVWVDLTGPLYWWKEFDTYKVGTVANSCSTMHKIAAKEFTLDDFSHEHLLSSDDIDRDLDNGAITDATKLENIPTLAAVLVDGSEAYYAPYGFLAMTCDVLNHFRELYLETKDKRYWWQMIQLLPSSYNQKRTVMLNYEVLANIYPARKAHKLDEWHTFCDWIRSLPESWIITGEDPEEAEETE